MSARSDQKVRRRFATWLMAAGACGLGTAVMAPGYSAPRAGDADANASSDFAERLSELASENLRGTALREPLLRESASLLEAAGREDPQEARYPRQLAHALAQLGDTAGEIDAWNQYIRVVAANGGEDRAAQAHIIDLYDSRIQTVDARLAYLRDVIARETIPPEVRAHAACLAVPLLLERSPEAATTMAEQAVKLYPLPEAVGYHYQLIDSKAGPAERVGGLLAMLKANPNQGLAVQALARELAEAGLAEESLEWYAAALSILNRSGSLPSHDFATEYVSELILAGQGRAAQSIVSRLLDLEPADPDFSFLDLTLARVTHQQVAFSLSLEHAREVFVQRWAAVNAAILGEPAPPAPDTRPGAVAPAVSAPDPARATAKLADPAQAQQIPAFVAIMNNLAWLELYYAERPDAAAPWINALEKVSGAKDTSVLRLQGWAAMESGKKKEARDIFEQAAGHDPLSAMGLVRLDEAEKLHADADALRQRTLRRYPAGVIAAMLHEALIPNLTLNADAPGGSAATEPTTAPTAKLGAGPATAPVRVPGPQSDAASKDGTAGPPGLPAASPATSAVAVDTASASTAPSVLTARVSASTTKPSVVDSIRNELAAFPKDWMGILDQPQRFYVLNADPLRSAHHFGDALYARITIRNLSGNNIFIGPLGVLKPQLWFDAVVRGITQQNFPGVAVDTLTGGLVLPPHAALSQVVRMDEGELADALSQHAASATQVTGLVMTNPLAVTNGVAPGPAGYRVAFVRNFMQLPTDLKAPAVRKRIFFDIDAGDPTEKMRGLESLGNYVQSLGRATDPAARALAAEILKQIVKTRDDGVPEVGAWAGYLAATLPGVDGQEQIVRGMIKSKYWGARLLGLAAARTLSTELQKQSADALAPGDPEPIVKSYAMAMVDELSHPTSSPSRRSARDPGGPAIDSGPANDNSGK